MSGSTENALESLQFLSATTAAIRRLSGLLDSAVLVQRAAQELHQLVGNDLSAVAVRERPDTLAMRGVAGARTPEFGRIRVPRGAGIGGKILLVRRSILVTDYERDPSISRDFVNIVAHSEGIHGMLGIPLEFEGELIGVLYAGLRSSNHIDDRVYSVTHEFARSLGPVIGASLQAGTAVRLGVEEERQRIATQLHDTIGQLLFGIGISARKARGRVPLEVSATASFGGLILAEAALSFLGLGVQPPTPAWGTMLSAGRAYLQAAPLVAMWPGLAIFITVLGFNLLGDAIRDATDPRLRRL